MEFVEIKTAGNKSSLQKQAIQPPPACSGVRAVPLDAAENALSLDGAVHTQQGPMDAVEVGKDLLMEASQFLVEANGTVAFGFGAFIFMGTAGAILTLVKLLCPAKAVALHRNRAEETEFFVVGAQESAVFIYPEVNSPIGVVPVFFVGMFFLIQREFHVYKPPFCERHQRGYETSRCHRVKILLYLTTGGFSKLHNPWR